MSYLTSGPLSVTLYILNCYKFFFNKRKFTSLTSSFSNKNINNWWVTGFADGESSFILSIRESDRRKIGWAVTLVFSIKLHIKELALLEQIKLFFGVGVITISKEGGFAIYSVRSVEELENVIIPHFIKYPLITKKRADFELFKLALDIISRGEHLTTLGLEKLINIRSAMNRGLTEKLKIAFPNSLGVLRPLIDFKEIPNPNWLVGFTDAEGCFNINTLNSPASKLGEAVRLRFTLVQHSRDIELMNSLMLYLGCGKSRPLRGID